MTTPTSEPATPRPSHTVPLLVLLGLLVLMSGVWWHIRTRHQPSLHLTGQVIALRRAPEDAAIIEVEVHGVPQFHGLFVEVAATDDSGPCRATVTGIEHEGEETARVWVTVWPASSAAWVTLHLSVARAAVVIVPRVDELLRLRPRREQVGRVVLKRIPLRD